MSGYDVLICACEDGPYLGARKAGTPCRCERCGFMTQDQFDHIMKHGASVNEVKVNLQPCGCYQAQDGSHRLCKPHWHEARSRAV